MQTFLPFADYALSARHLDGRRLSNQRRESLTLIRGGWKNHPAAKMWLGYKHHLALYSIAICNECIARGYVDSRHYFEPFLALPDTGPPWWLGDEQFHAAHRSNLARKNPEFYVQWGWVDTGLEYIWPEGRRRTIRRLRTRDR